MTDEATYLKSNIIICNWEDSLCREIDEILKEHEWEKMYEDCGGFAP